MRAICTFRSTAFQMDWRFSCCHFRPSAISPHSVSLNWLQKTTYPRQCALVVSHCFLSTISLHLNCFSFCHLTQAAMYSCAGCSLHKALGWDCSGGSSRSGAVLIRPWVLVWGWICLKWGAHFSNLNKVTWPDFICSLQASGPAPVIPCALSCFYSSGGLNISTPSLVPLPCQMQWASAWASGVRRPECKAWLYH